MKIRKTIYWIVGIIVLLGWTDLVWGKTPSSTKTVINQTAGDTLEIEVKGLVCSFCAHGLNKGIGKMDYTNEKGIFVDIDNQIVRVILNKRYKAIPSSVINQTIEVIENSGYEVHKITYQNKVIIVRKEKGKHGN
jgi:ribosomal protein L24E